MRSLAGRASGLWLTLLAASPASSTYNLNNLKVTLGHACTIRLVASSLPPLKKNNYLL